MVQYKIVHPESDSEFIAENPSEAELQRWENDGCSIITLNEEGEEYIEVYEQVLKDCLKDDYNKMDLSGRRVMYKIMHEIKRQIFEKVVEECFGKTGLIVFKQKLEELK